MSIKIKISMNPCNPPFSKRGVRQPCAIAGGFLSGRSSRRHLLEAAVERKNPPLREVPAGRRVFGGHCSIDQRAGQITHRVNRWPLNNERKKNWFLNHRNAKACLSPDAIGMSLLLSALSNQFFRSVFIGRAASSLTSLHTFFIKEESMSAAG